MLPQAATVFIRPVVPACKIHKEQACVNLSKKEEGPFSAMPSYPLNPILPQLHLASKVQEGTRGMGSLIHAVLGETTSILGKDSDGAVLGLPILLPLTTIPVTNLCK